MRNVRKQCIDCGSEAVQTIVDEVKPVYRMEIIDFACGAVLKTVLQPMAISAGHHIRVANTLKVDCRHKGRRCPPKPGHVAMGIFLVFYAGSMSESI